MSFLKWTVAGALVAALGAGASAKSPLLQVDGGGAGPKPPLLRPYPYQVDFPYEFVPDHFKPNFPAGWTWGNVAAMYAESPNRIFVYQQGILPSLGDKYLDASGYPATRTASPLRYDKLVRGEYIVTVFDANGNRIEHWKEFDTYPAHPSSGHHIKVDPSDPEKHIWFVDEGERDLSVVGGILKYTRDGKRVMKIGNEICRNPQDIAFLPNGDFWCLSGFDYPGVHKFTKDGKPVPGTGFATKQGPGPYELNQPHSIAIDKRQRIYIGDRANVRVQVFDQSGKLLETWPYVTPRSMAIDKNDRLWAICGTENCGKDKPPYSMSVHDLNDHGKVLFTWGVAGGLPGQFFFNGQFDVDSQGNFYMGEVGGGRMQMWRPRPGANPNHLIPYPLTR